MDSKQNSQSEQGFKKNKLSSSLQLVLENRLLFDGAVVPVINEALNTEDHSTSNSSHDNSSSIDGAWHEGFSFDIQDDVNKPVNLPLPTPESSIGDCNQPSLIIADPRSESIRNLLSKPPANTEIKVLDTGKDGYSQIADILANRDRTENVILQTAEKDGKIWLGASQIMPNLRHAESEASMDWGDMLDTNSKITLHGAPIVGYKSIMRNIEGLTGSKVYWNKESTYDDYTISSNEIDSGGRTQTEIKCNELTTPPVTSLVFIDTSVQGYQNLLQNIDQNAKVILLNSESDELSQIVASVSQEENISAIHIVSHGSEGQLKLGAEVLNQASMQEKYADELKSMRQHLSANADIFIYGCDFGKGDLGQKATELLAKLTDADVADSTNATGSAKLGGDWKLERQIGLIESKQELNGSNMAEFSGLLDLPAPNVTLSGKTDVLIGNNFSFTATFDNTAKSGTGYAPYIDLAFPTTGKDGSGAASDDGINFVSANYLGKAVTAISVTFDATGHATHPIAEDGTGAPLIISASAYGLQAGDTLVVLVLPFGSVTANQPTIPIEITAKLSNLADVSADASNNLSISALAGFRFGTDALDNPTTDPSIQQGTVKTFSVHPTLVTMSQTFNGPEQETATGQNYVRQLTTETTPATGQSLTNFDVTQVLPDSLIVTKISPDLGGFVNSITLRDGTTITDQNLINSTLLSGSYLESYTVRYTKLDAPVKTLLDFYIPQDDFSGNPVLNVNSGDDRSINVAAPIGTGFWTPIDTRDSVSSISAVADDGNATVIEAKSITIKKSFLIQNDTGSTGTTPGDTLQYTLKVDVSDYFAFGRDITGNGSWLINDVMGDGQTWDSSYVPTLIYTDGTGSHSVILIRGTHFTVGNAAGDNSGFKASDGRTYLQFDLAEVLTHLQGDLHGDNTLNGASTVSIKLRSLIDDSYQTVYSQSALNEGDSIDNGVETDTTLLNRSLAMTGLSEADDSEVSTTLGKNEVSTSIIGVNGTLGAPTQLKPGDTLTIKIRYDLKTGDYENFKLISFLPLPVLNTNDANADGILGDPWVGNGTWDGTSSDLPTIGQWKYGTDNNAGLLSGGVTDDGTANSLTFDFGNNSDTSNLPKTVEVIYSIKVGDQPFADQLLLTLLAESSQQTTINGNIKTTHVLVKIELVKPNGIQPDQGTTPEDTPITVDVLANDGFKPGAVISAINGTSITDGGPAVSVPDGSVQLLGGKLVFTPNPDFNGLVPTFTYTVTTASGSTETANVDITVTPVIDIQPDQGITPEDTPITVDVLANDGFKPGAVISAINGTSITDGGPAVSVPDGSVQLLGGKLVFTPNPDFNGLVPTFTYTVTTASGSTETANVDIKVTSINNPPVANDDGPTITQANTHSNGNVLDNDTDADNDPLVVTKFTVAGVPGEFVAGTTAVIPGVGTLLINKDGSYDFAPNPDYTGPVPSTTYTISDGKATSSAVLSFSDVPSNSVIPNSPPLANDDGPTITQANTHSIGESLFL